MSNIKSANRSSLKRYRSPINRIRKKRKRRDEATGLHPLLHLQQTIGNQAVGRLIQAKLKVSQPGDKDEQEADRVADKVMRMPTSQVQRQPKEDEEEKLSRQPQEEEKKEVQRIPLKKEEEKDALKAKAAGGNAPHVSPRVQSQIHSLRGGGKPLPSSERAFFEPRFGHDFSQVRVHTDRDAAETAAAVNAKAFTVGHNVAFGSGQYAPQTTEGRRLLAHELMHFVQQNGNTFLIQKEESERAKSETSEWDTIVEKAKSALAKKDLGNAAKYYREAIVFAASNINFPEGIEKINPKTEDIALDFKLSDDTDAETRPKEIPANEDNYWRWIFFGTGSILKTRSLTQSVIVHELIHVRQFKKVWASYKKDKAVPKKAWLEYLKPFTRAERVVGPEELEATLTGIDFLTNLSSKEQDFALRGIFVSYIKTTEYRPPTGEAGLITPATAKTQVLDFYNKANTDLKERMGAAVWWSLIKVDASKELWLEVMKELKPIVDKGYSDPIFQANYDAFLKLKGIKK